MIRGGKYKGDCEYLNNLILRLCNCGGFGHEYPESTEDDSCVKWLNFGMSCLHFRMSRLYYSKKQYCWMLLSIIYELLMCIFFLIFYFICTLIIVIWVILGIVIISLLFIIGFIIFFVINLLLCCMPMGFIFYLWKTQEIVENDSVV